MIERMLRFLTDTEQPITRYVPRAALLTLVPAMLLGFLVGALIPDGAPEFGAEGWPLFIGVVFFSPVIETLMMGLVFWPIRRVTPRLLNRAVLSAIVWALLHSAAAPAWGLVVLWPFFVFSLCFLSWEKRGTARALLVTGLVHATHNLVPGILMMSG